VVWGAAIRFPEFGQGAGGALFALGILGMLVLPFAVIAAAALSANDLVRGRREGMPGYVLGGILGLLLTLGPVVTALGMAWFS
jgi:hypothetical protein